MSERKIGVTGIGIACSIGIGKNNFWDAIKDGYQDRQADNEVFPGTDFKNKWFYNTYINGQKPTIEELAITACHEAIIDSGLDIESEKSVGLYLGCAVGNIYKVENQLKRGCHDTVDPFGFFINKLANNLLVNNIAFSTTACVSGITSLIRAIADIKLKKIKRAIVCGVDSFSFTAMACFNEAGVLGIQQAKPFGSESKGLIGGSGAGVLVVEEVTDSNQYYCEIKSSSFRNDTYSLISSSPDGSSMAECIKKTLEIGYILPDEVNVIISNATGMPISDNMEFQALKKIFGESLYDKKIINIKSQCGHTYGASGLISAITGILSNKNNSIIPIDIYPISKEFSKLDIYGGEYPKGGYTLGLSYASGGPNCTFSFKF
ncbi:MAG: hypothetical protein AUJ97_07255 [Bacteroidetes bacterium CG2_30_32_10]|nr:MAG: hypothetical protein AUJ97_07255 [Bacteroidetes bacterium CG2_30_32_10]